MGNLNLEKDTNYSNTNPQDEIHQLFEDIKRFEKKYENFDIEKIDVKEQQIYVEPEISEEFQPFDVNEKQIEAETELSEEFVELDEKVEKIDFKAETLTEFQPIEDIEESKKPKFKFKIRKLKPRTEVEKGKIEKPINPTTFRFRFNDEGKFENIDLKKSKLKIKTKKPFSLKAIKIRKKTKTDSQDEEKNLRFSKLKTGLAKLKRVIPNKSSENKITDENKKENDFTYYN